MTPADATTDRSVATAVAVVGGGPAGLMAAERLSAAGIPVDLYDAMPSVGRKFLLAGKGGLNLTHAEARPGFDRRYGERAADVAPWLDDFGPDALRAWAAGLGVDTFVGTSQRVFPVDLKAAPLLRAWLHRLRHPAAGAPVRFHMRHRWLGWDAQGRLRFATPQGDCAVAARATVLALGGASWPRLGSDGAWVSALEAVGLPVAPLRPANAGFDVEAWSPLLVERFAGQPFKSVAIRVQAADGRVFQRKGEFVLTATGVEGSLIYAASALLRDTIEATGQAALHLNLLPDRSPGWVREQVTHPRGARSLSSHLKSRLRLDGLKLAILHECLDRATRDDPEALAAAIQAVPITLRRVRPIAEAISTAGGVRWDALTPDLMARARPGLFVAGEMLDWEAPTGGYLLTAVMASGVRAGEGVVRWLGAGGGAASGASPDE